MNKKRLILAALLLACATAAAHAQPLPPEELAAFRHKLMLVVWVPLILTLFSELTIKFLLLMRFAGQEKAPALKFSAAATVAEFVLTSVAMMLLYRPTVMLRRALAQAMGDPASATFAGLLSAALLFMVFWKLYALALKRFLGIGAAQEGQPASGWSLLRLSGVMAALHPLLLNLFTVLAYFLLVKRG